jgi:hypothetical protein
LVEFLDLFGARNVTRDDQLARLVAQARGIIADATPDSLKSDVGLRERVRNGMQQVTAAVDTLIRDTPRRRRFDLDSE